MNVDAFNVVPEVSYAIFIFFFLSFFYILFCISDFHHPVLQVTYPFICISYSAIDSGLPDSSAGKNLPAMQETLGRFLGQEDPLEKG